MSKFIFTYNITTADGTSNDVEYEYRTSARSVDGAIVKLVDTINNNGDVQITKEQRESKSNIVYAVNGDPVIVGFIINASKAKVFCSIAEV